MKNRNIEFTPETGAQGQDCFEMTVDGIPWGRFDTQEEGLKWVEENLSGGSDVPEYSERDELLGLISDMSKDLNGTRPSLARWVEAPLNELREEVQSLQTMLNDWFEEKQRFEGVYRQNKKDEFTASVKACLKAGAPDLETAKRWAKSAR